MLKRSKLWVLTMLLIVVALASACAPERPSSAGDPEASAPASTEANNGAAVEEEEKPENLLLWVNNEDEAAAITEIAKPFTDETGIPVVVEVATDMSQKLALAAPAGNGPDLFYQPQDILGNMVAQGLVAPLEMEESVRNGYTEGAIKAVTYDGVQYGAPAVIETYALYYNKDLVPTPPATFDDILELVPELTVPSEDRYAFMMTPDIYYLYTFIQNYGGYIFGEQDGVYDPLDIGLNTPGAIEGLTKFQEFYKQTQIPPTTSIDVMDTLFAEGKVGMIVNGPWALANYQDRLGDSLGTAILPQVNGKPSPSFIGVKSWFISSYAKSTDYAARLALFLTNDENAMLYYEKKKETPPKMAILDQLNDPVLKGFFDQIEYGTPMPNIPEMSMVWEVDNGLDFIVKGDDVQAVMDETVANIKQQIEASIE